MMQFAQMFPDSQIVAQLATKLSWTHFLIVMPLKDKLQREFYLTMAANFKAVFGLLFLCPEWKKSKKLQ